LRGLVRPYLGYFLRNGVAAEHHGLPDTSLTFVLSFDEPLEVAWLAEPRSADRRWTVVAGLHDQPAVITHRGFQHGVQLALTPAGCRALLGVPAAALRGEMVDLGDLLGGVAPALYDAVAEESSWPARFRALDVGLAALLARRALRPPDRELREAWRRLHLDPTTRVEALAADLGWSRRRLHARFVAEVGVGPKQVARLVRFQRARARLARGEPIGAVAAATGFSDQPHLTREWSALAGRTPAEWLREELPFVQDATAAPLAPSGA
jgi:AraC-like DNA-binding protein